MRVVFPDPLGPINPRMVPSDTSRLTWSAAITSPNARVASRIWISGVSSRSAGWTVTRDGRSTGRAACAAIIATRGQRPSSDLLGATMEAAGLELESREAARLGDRDLRAHAEVTMDLVLDRAGKAGRVDAGPRLERAAQRIHAPLGVGLDAEFDDVVEAADDVLEDAREDVHAAHREHVVHPAEDPGSKLHVRAPAAAGSAGRPHAVAGPVTDRRRAPAAEVREDELALPFVRDGAVLCTDLDDELALDEMHAVPRAAAESGRSDLRRAGVVERRDPEGLLDARPRRRDRRARLPGVDRDPQRGPREVDAIVACDLRQAQRVCRRAHQDGRLGRDERAEPLARGHRTAGARERAEVLATGA